jgi:hypothetical protein
MDVGRLQATAGAPAATPAREDSVLGKSRPLYLCLLVGSALLGAALPVGPGPVAGPASPPVGIGSGHVDLMADGPSAVVPGPAEGVANVRDFGAVGNGIADDTVPVQEAIDSLAASGGVVFFPAGRYRINGQLALPNDGESSDPRQPPFAFSGVGAFFDPRKGIPTGGSLLDLRFDGPKIVTYGLGLFEAHGVTFASFGGDSEPFIYTTNTTLHIHDCGFYGNKPHHTADNDAIILGGTNAAAVGSNDPNAPFQGYGTVIRDNYFARIRRVVYGRVFANAVVVTGNTVWSNCGTNLPGGAAIELDGDPDETTTQVNGGWYVAGNLIETTHYPYGIKCRESQRNAFIANNFYDPGAATIAYHRFEPTGKLNYVVAGFHDDSRVFVQEEAVGTERSTVIDFHQLQESRYAQKSRFLEELILEPNASSDAPFGPRLVSSGGAELTYQMTDDSGMVVWYTPNLGAPVQLWQVRDAGDGNIVQELKGTEAEIRNLNGSVKLLSAAGSELELGDTSGEGVKIEEGRIEFSSTSVQMLSGSGEPTMSAPDGSIYLRTDGGSGTTFYVRESGVWVAK